MDQKTGNILDGGAGRGWRTRMVTARLPLWISLVCFFVSSVFLATTVVDLWPTRARGPHWSGRSYLGSYANGTWQIIPYDRNVEIEYQVEVSDRFWPQQPPGCVSPIYSCQSPTIRLNWNGSAAPGPLDPDVAEPLTAAVIGTYMSDGRTTDPAPLDAREYEFRYYDDGHYTLVVFGRAQTHILWAGLFLSIGAWVNLFVFLWSCPCSIISIRRRRRERRAAWFEESCICPGCRYGLRGADHAKCPECGGVVPWFEDVVVQAGGVCGSDR